MSEAAQDGPALGTTPRHRRAVPRRWPALQHRRRPGPPARRSRCRWTIPRSRPAAGHGLARRGPADAARAALAHGPPRPRLGRPLLRRPRPVGRRVGRLLRPDPDLLLRLAAGLHPGADRGLAVPLRAARRGRDDRLRGGGPGRLRLIVVAASALSLTPTSAHAAPVPEDLLALIRPISDCSLAGFDGGPDCAGETLHGPCRQAQNLLGPSRTWPSRASASWERPDRLLPGRHHLDRPGGDRLVPPSARAADLRAEAHLLTEIVGGLRGS